MQTLSKQQVSNWILIDYNAQKQVFQEKIHFLERKYIFLKENMRLTLYRSNKKLNRQIPKVLKLGTITLNGKPINSFYLKY